MASVKSLNVLHRIILFQILLLSLTVSSFSQTKQSYRNHEEIDVGGGMKVEILKCTGDGPTEECDCIYFTDKRQNGIRMKQNANRLKEEERAAELAKGVHRPETKKSRSLASGNVTNNRADKAIPESIKPRPSAPAAKHGISLEDAAKRADSIAKASSEKLKESLPETTDSTEMDKVYIPSVTHSGKAQLEDATPKSNTGNPNTGNPTAANQNPISQKLPKDVGVDTASAASISANATKTTPVPPKDTAGTVNPSAQQGNVHSTNTTAPAAPQGSATVNPPVVIQSGQANETLKSGAALKNADVNPASPAAVGTISTNNSSKASETKKDTSDSGSSNPALKTATAVNDASAAITSATDRAETKNEDSTENNWVKQYNNVKPAKDTSGASAGKPVPNEGTRTDSTVNSNNEEALKTALKNETETSGSGTMDSPVLNGKSLKKNTEKIKKQATKVSKAAASQNNSLPSVNNSTPGYPKATSAGNPAVAVNNTNAATTGSKEPVNDTISSQTLSSVTTAPENKTEDNHAVVNNTNVAVTGISNANTSTSAINVIGKTAEVKSKGVWEKATIIDKETEFLYKVHYKGTSADRDEWVAVTQIRNIDTTSNAANKPNSDKPAKVSPKVNINCSFDAPAPPVLNSDKFSEKLAKRKIYDNYMAEKKGNSHVKTGVTFLSVKSEEPYVNTVSISATNNLEVKLSLAPSGAMIYPVEAQYKLCEQVLGKTTSKTMNANYACFRNKSGSWSCAKLD